MRQLGHVSAILWLNSYMIRRWNAERELLARKTSLISTLAPRAGIISVFFQLFGSDFRSSAVFH
jgi:hypothetical protein